MELANLALSVQARLLGLFAKQAVRAFDDQPINNEMVQKASFMHNSMKENHQRVQDDAHRKTTDIFD